MSVNGITFEELKSELGECVKNARQLVGDLFTLATKCAIASDISELFVRYL